MALFERGWLENSRKFLRYSRSGTMEYCSEHSRFSLCFRLATALEAVPSIRDGKSTQVLSLVISWMCILRELTRQYWLNDARDDFNETLYNCSFNFFSEKFEEFDSCYSFAWKERNQIWILLIICIMFK